MRYELSKPAEYRQAKYAAPIAYIPWGAAEWHGTHNPLGLDALKSHGHALALCAETGGVVFPPINIACQTMKGRGFDCSFMFSPECVKMLAREYLNNLADEGFKVVAIVMGHQGRAHMEAVREAVSEFNEAQSECVGWAFPENEFTADVGIRGDHAGATETSYMMYFHPESVDLSRLPSDGELSFEKNGIGGLDPRTEASAQKGLRGTNALVKNAAPRILELLAKGKTSDK